MHTETDTTRTEAFIARNRAAIATTAGVLLFAALMIAYMVIAAFAHIGSHNLAYAVTGLSALAGIVAGLATYWGTE